MTRKAPTKLAQARTKLAQERAAGRRLVKAATYAHDCKETLRHLSRASYALHYPVWLKGREIDRDEAREALRAARAYIKEAMHIAR